MTAFLDTSVVVRYLVGDGGALAEQAIQIIDTDETLVLSELVLVETAYVLSSVYEVPRDALVDALMALLQRQNIRLANLSKSRALEGLRLCKPSNRVSFTDALLWAEARDAKASTIYSFDQRFPVDGLKRAP